MGPRFRGDDIGDRVSRMFPPERIVCLTEETVETLYLLWNTGTDATGRFPSWNERFI